MKRILVGLDGSSRAPGVLATGAAIARAQGARLILLRTVGLPADVPQDFWKTTDEPLLDVLCRDARTYLGRTASGLPAELVDKIEVRVGTPWQAICEAARADGVDLIVVGSHGYSGLDHVLGTTAAKVVNHAACSVLVTREAERV